MKKKDKVDYWIESAKYDWVAVTHLLEKGDYSYALFFGHLTVEKLLKAVFVDRFDEPPPFTHSLPYLAKKAGLRLSPERLNILETVTDFNLEARYPDEKFSFRKRCTKKFTETHLKEIREIKEWLLSEIGQ